MAQRSRNPVSQLLVFFFFSMAGCLPGSVAQAFEMFTTSDGTPLKWDKTEVAYHVNVDSIPHYLEPAAVLKVVQRSFETWARVKGAALTFRYAGPTTSRGGFEVPPGANQNVIYFVTDSWTGSPDALAETRVTFDDLGRIADADIRINAVDVEWSISDESVVFDLQNMLTHEIGHLIGLAHSDVPESTMYGESRQYEVFRRTLSDDDISGIRFLYPAVLEQQQGELILARYTGNAPGCSASTGSERGAELWAVLAGLLLLSCALTLRRKGKSDFDPRRRADSKRQPGSQEVCR